MLPAMNNIESDRTYLYKERLASLTHKRTRTKTFPLIMNSTIHTYCSRPKYFPSIIRRSGTTETVRLPTMFRASSEKSYSTDSGGQNRDFILLCSAQGSPHVVTVVSRLAWMLALRLRSNNNNNNNNKCLYSS